MYALKYGTIPVVRATGGLEDTIVQFNARIGEGNGLKFTPFTSEALFKASRKAVDLFQDSKSCKKLRTNGMKADFSWDRSARAYLELYRSHVEG